MINSIKKAKGLKGKRVLLRLDLNAPLKAGKVLDDHRLVIAKESINYLLKKGAKVIAISHLGKAKGSVDKDLSLKPVANRLKIVLKHPVKFIAEHQPEKALLKIEKMKNGEIVLLENLRFNPGELENDSQFAKNLASLADVYVNDAFSVSHRKQASVAAIKRYLDSYAGLFLEKELKALDRILKPKKPFVIIMGGAKVKTKAPLIKKLLPKADQLLLGGALANTFIKELGYEVAKSLCDSDAKEMIKKIFKTKRAEDKIILPIDLVVASTRTGKTRLIRPDEVKKGEAILDIGPETITLFSKYIRKASTLIWNGPMGKFEEEHFRQGSLSLARLVAARSKGIAYGVVGGGETVSVLNMTKMQDYVDFVSGGGGAMLAYLGGEKMPGLDKIVK